MKAAIVTDAITIVGIIAISSLLFVQLPGMIDDIKVVMEKESALAKAKELASLIALSNSAPSEIRLVYKLPENANVTAGAALITVTMKDTASYKTLSNLRDFSRENVDTLTIRKVFENGIPFIEVG
ncbi:MAG: hypothetical protein QXD72_01160 [Candidatus Aenigmatarchaeota archaeon]